MPPGVTRNPRASDVPPPAAVSRHGEYNGPVNDLERDLRRVVRGSVRFDPASLLLYSTDASMYQVEPIGVVTPRDGDDVIAAFDVARRQKVALLPRGGGTSLTGQTVNRALVLDFSQHMNGVLEVNAEELWARVQPGLVQDELNHAIRDLGLLFGPDTSTSNRATLGGMVGNNSGGSHSIAYGLTVEHVLELDALLADGTRVRFGTVTPAEFEAKMRLPGAEGRIYREVAAIRAEYAEEIRKRYPKHWRRVAGYNLNEVVKDGPLNMARVVVGSEGTLLTVLEAKVRLVRRPKKTALDVIHYASIQEALESSQSILETGPYAVELTDKLILDLARDNIEQRARAAFVQGDPGAILIVEYAGESDGEVASKVDALEARRVRSDTQQPVGDERLRLSFCVDRLGTFEFERALGKLPRGVPDQNVARLRGLLEPRGDVDGVTGRKGAALAHHDLAGVDSHPDLQLGAELALKVRIEVAELFAQLVRGPSGA